MDRYGVIVDGYSTGAGLANAFSEYGFKCIHVQSSEVVPKVYEHTFNINHYVFNILYDNIISLIKKITCYNPEFVVAGAECGIELADKLANQLNLPCNDIRLSAARRNKHLMWQAAKNYGLNVIPSQVCRTEQDAITWVQEQNHFPLVVKPVNSAGGEGVSICYSMHDVTCALNCILKQKSNMLGFENKLVFLQYYIEGKEYVINTASCHGKHKLCEIWEYSRFKVNESIQIYDSAKLVEFDNKQHNSVVQYAFTVLEALGIVQGAAHIEIITNSTGCYLIELGARLMGANLPFSLLDKCSRTPQTKYVVMTYADSEQFINNLHIPYKVTQHLEAVFMVSKKHGYIENILHLDTIKKLKSFHSLKLAVQQEGELSVTVDYQTCPGMIYLTHADENQIEHDKNIIRELESKLFSVKSLEVAEIEL
jgi:carbamoylphosphate synthase large subunit